MQKVLITLLLTISVTGCNRQNSLPNEILVTLPAIAVDGTKWGFEANKMTGKIDELVIGEDGKKKDYKVGDEININGQNYLVKEFLYDEHYLENKKGGVIVKLQSKK
ncbi:hypothetical protein [Effusibacillus pohliae]|uniref:hypothetical protein n=1 Tax=Effusibacillus pohliae TaxID=232270 RepID=UPI00037B17C6|nr:hypothetical protein [Effusibacillus pohliae]